MHLLFQMEDTENCTFDVQGYKISHKFFISFFIRILLQDIITGYRGKLRLLSTPPDRSITDMNSVILNIK